LTSAIGYQLTLADADWVSASDCLRPVTFARWASAAAETWRWCSRDATVSCAQEPDLHCGPAPTRAN